MFEVRGNVFPSEPASEGLPARHRLRPPRAQDGPAPRPVQAAWDKYHPL